MDLSSTSIKRFAEATKEQLKQNIEYCINKNTLFKSKWAMNIMQNMV